MTRGTAWRSGGIAAAQRGRRTALVAALVLAVGGCEQLGEPSTAASGEAAGPILDPAAPAATGPQQEVLLRLDNFEVTPIESVLEVDKEARIGFWNASSRRQIVNLTEMLQVGTCADITTYPAPFPGPLPAPGYSSLTQIPKPVRTFETTGGVCPKSLPLDIGEMKVLSVVPRAGGTYVLRYVSTGTADFEVSTVLIVEGDPRFGGFGPGMEYQGDVNVLP